MAASSAPAARRKRAVESFQTAAECIGTIEPGASLFAITRGQFSMIDAILHVLDQIGPGAAVSIWPRTVAIQRADLITRLRIDDRIVNGRLVIQTGDDQKNSALMSEWREKFGPASIRHLNTHAKIATVEGAGLHVLLRGSINLGAGARFEQFDLTEGGADFDYVRQVEENLPIAEATDGQKQSCFPS